MSQLILFGLPPLPASVENLLARELGAYLGSAMDMPVEVRLYANYSELSDHLAEGRLDFAWLPPLPAAGLRRHCGIAMLAHAVRLGLDAYYSVLFTREDSPIQAPEDLDGKKIGFVHRRSASGFLVAEARLRRLGIRPQSPPTFLKSHAKVAEAVAGGSVDAGATFCSFHGEPDEGKVALAGWIQAEIESPMRLVLCTDPIPADVICAWPGTSKILRESMTSALLSMASDPAARDLMHGIFGADRFDARGTEDLDLLDMALESPQGGQGDSE